MNIQWYPGHMTKAKRAMQEDIKLIDLIIEVVDARIPFSSRNPDIDELGKNKARLILLNKSDLTSVITEEEMKGYLNKRILSISAKHRIGIDELENTIEEMFFEGKIQMNEEVYITNARHTASLMEVQSSLKLVKQSILDGMPEDFYSIDLMNAYEELGKIIGESVEDDLVNEIFSKFCMGK